MRKLILATPASPSAENNSTITGHAAATYAQIARRVRREGVEAASEHRGELVPENKISLCVFSDHKTLSIETARLISGVDWLEVLNMDELDAFDLGNPKRAVEIAFGAIRDEYEMHPEPRIVVCVAAQDVIREIALEIVPVAAIDRRIEAAPLNPGDGFELDFVGPTLKELREIRV